MQREQLKRRKRYSSLLWPILILLVSGCAKNNGAMGTDTAIDPVPNPENAEDTNLVLSAGDVLKEPLKGYDKFLKDGKKLRDLLEAYDGVAGNSGLNLKQLTEKLRERNRYILDAGGNGPGIAPFRGLGGGYFHSFLDAAEYDGDQPATVELSGSIVGYTFKPNKKYKKGEGILQVDTYQEVTKNGVSETVNYLWDIIIKNNGYRIHKIVKLDGHPSPDDPDAPNPVYPPNSVLDNWDPFPNTLVFDRDMKKRIWKKGYNVKLHARGRKAIKVKNVWRDGNIITMADPDFRPLLKTGKESCVDMFLRLPLKNDEPDLTKIPKDLNELRNEDDEEYAWAYCLGRCAHPAIINSR